MNTDLEKNDKILEILVKAKKIDEKQIEAISLEKQHCSLSTLDAIMKLKILSEKEVGKALESYYNVPFADLAAMSFNKDIFLSFPEDVMREHKVLPIQITENTLTVAMINPNDIILVENLQIICGLSVKPVVALEPQISKVIEKYFSYDSMSRIIKESVIDKSMISSMRAEEAVLDPKEGSHGPVSKMIDSIIEDAVMLRASDVHIEPQEDNVFVRYRIDGVLQTKTSLPKEIQSVISSRIKIMGSMDISDKRTPQDGQANVVVKKRNIDLRISTLPGKYGEKIVIRILDKSGFSVGIENLGFLPEAQTRFEEILNQKNGIILVTGPTGSGKSTTLYAAINRLKSGTKNIITLEDPVEYELLSGQGKECGITQVQINPKVGLTFTTALKACLRQDPDVILIGEIRDLETCTIATNAALMGHLVLSSIHTNDAASTITRLMDMGVEPFLIAESLRCIVSQRLARTLCVFCRESYSPPKQLLDRLNIKNLGSELAFYRAKGCPRCNNIGYSGRTAIVEVLIMDQYLRELIVKRESLKTLRDAAKKAGMVTMRQSALTLVMKGMSTMAEVMRVVPFEN
jgi:type IV pilus assembly protein PilB